MSEPIEAEVQRVEQDALCRRCGYNLRGLEVTGNCPECGAAVEQSIHGDLLQYSSVPWLETVRRGFTWVLWGILVQIVGVIAGAIVFHGNQVLVEVWALAVGMVSLLGMWWITEPDPADQFTASRPRDAKARVVIRVTLLLSLALTVARIGCSPAILGGAAGMIGAVLECLSGISGLVSAIAQFTYIAGLADRIPHLELGRLSRGLRKAYAIVASIFIVISGVAGFLVAARAGDC